MPREVSGGALLEHGLSGTGTLVLRGRVQLAQIVCGVWQCAQRAEHRVGNDAGLGLQERQNPRVLVVFGLHSLHRGKVVDQVLHALVVSVVEIVRKLRQ